MFLEVWHDWKRHEDRGRSERDTERERARQSIHRLTAQQVARAYDAGALVIDTRSHRFASVRATCRGAIVIERNIMEWRLDLTRP